MSEFEEKYMCRACGGISQRLENGEIILEELRDLVCSECYKKRFYLQKERQERDKERLKK